MHKKILQKKIANYIVGICTIFIIAITCVICIINMEKSKSADGETETNLPIIATGNSHTLAIVDGTLYAWGYNSYGQLGDGTNMQSYSPVKIGTATNWVSVTAGASHSLAINSEGELWGWGRNDNGQLGLSGKGDRLAPVKLNNETNWVRISAGTDHSHAINSLGELYAWGGNSYGQLGSAYPVLDRVDDRTNWVDVQAGHYYSLALNEQGELYGWGRNEYGQLGINTYEDPMWYPVKVFGYKNWVSFSAGYEHSLAINDRGELYGWGKGRQHQLGLGFAPFEYYGTPQRIGDQSNWKSISSGYLCSFAINDLGELWSWGTNIGGDLGLGDTTDQEIPTRFGDQTNWLEILGGCFFSRSWYAINTAGELYAWGDNNQGQLGLGDKTDRNEPTEVNFWYDVAAPNFGTGYSISSLSQTKIDLNDSYTFKITSLTGYTNGIPNITLNPAKGILTLTSTNENTRTYTVNNVKGDIYSADFTVEMPINVAAPNDGTGYTVEETTTNWVYYGGDFSFTVTFLTGYTFGVSNVTLDPTKGNITLTATNGDSRTYTVGNVTDIITSTDFTIKIPFSVATPADGAGYSVSDTSDLYAFVDESYTFTVTKNIGYNDPEITLNPDLGKLACVERNGNQFVFEVYDITGPINVSDFTVTISIIVPDDVGENPNKLNWIELFSWFLIIAILVAVLFLISKSILKRMKKGQPRSHG